MKKNFTLNIFAGSKKTIVLALAGTLFVISMVMVGCYAFRTINQPSEGYTNSYFDVPIVAQRDADPGLDDNAWNGKLEDIGLFGVMLPNGWEVTDSIAYTIVSKGAGLNNSGYLLFDAGNSKTLQDSLPAPSGYHWWGAITDRIASLNQFDSLYFTPRIKTDGKTGSFFLQYAIGDRMDANKDRNPYDHGSYGRGLSDPMSISITSNVGLKDILSKSNVSMYPNPTRGILNVNLTGYKSEVIKMTVCDSRGRVVMAKEILKKSNLFDLSNLAKGIYVVELKNGINKSSSKIIIN
jgi:uncharacterized protein YceK